TATRLLKQYKTLEDVYKHLDDISGKKLKENLTTYKSDAFMSQELVTINRQSPITISVNDLAYSGLSDVQIYEVFKAFGFHSLIDRFDLDVEHEQSDL